MASEVSWIAVRSRLSDFVGSIGKLMSRFDVVEDRFDALLVLFRVARLVRWYMILCLLYLILFDFEFADFLKLPLCFSFLTALFFNVAQ